MSCGRSLAFPQSRNEDVTFPKGLGRSKHSIDHRLACLNLPVGRCGRHGFGGGPFDEREGDHGLEPFSGVGVVLERGIHLVDPVAAVVFPGVGQQFNVGDGKCGRLIGYTHRCFLCSRVGGFSAPLDLTCESLGEANPSVTGRETTHHAAFDEQRGAFLVAPV